MADAHRALAGKGRLLVRPSGTEPIIRIYAESKSEQDADRLAKKVMSEIAALS